MMVADIGYGMILVVLSLLVKYLFKLDKNNKETVNLLMF